MVHQTHTPLLFLPLLSTVDTTSSDESGLRRIFLKMARAILRGVLRHTGGLLVLSNFIIFKELLGPKTGEMERFLSGLVTL